MMTIYLSVFFGIVAAQLAPGPNLLAVASVALAQVRQPALCVAAGVASGVLIWVSGCAFGVVALFKNFPLAGIFLQIIGGVYFLWLAWRALSAIRIGSASSIRASKHLVSLIDAYKRGLFVVLTNPKAAMMWVAITAFLLGSGFTTQEVLIVAPIGALFGILFASFGLKFLYDGVRELDSML